jgi:hypothetical protein
VDNGVTVAVTAAPIIMGGRRANPDGGCKRLGPAPRAERGPTGQLLSVAIRMLDRHSKGVFSSWQIWPKDQAWQHTVRDF